MANRRWLGTLAAVAVLTVGVAIAMRFDVGPTDVPVTTSTTERATTTVRPTEVAGTLPGIWPFASQEAVDAYVADPGVGMFFDGEATALEFAREYLGMPEPVARGAFVEGPGATGSVEIAARSRLPMTTAVQMRRFGGDDGPWSVIGSSSTNIKVDRPAPLQRVGNPIMITGRSTAFEATVSVEVRQDGQPHGQHLGRSVVMGGASGELEPFAGAITIDPPTSQAGAVILFIESAEDGALQEAAVVRVMFDGAA